MRTLLFRTLALAALGGGALAAHAVNAYSNLGTGSNLYLSGLSSAYLISPFQIPVVGFQFTSGVTGALTGFQLGINDIGAARPFSLSLYADSGSNTLGAMLGTYSGTSTGQDYSTTTSSLASVPATGATLALGSKYWLTATTSSFNNQVAWNYSTASGLIDRNGTYQQGPLGAFSVQVSAVPEPSALAALGLGVVAVLRRRHRAA